MVGQVILGSKGGGGWSVGEWEGMFVLTSIVWVCGRDPGMQDWLITWPGFIGGVLIEKRA